MRESKFRYEEARREGKDYLVKYKVFANIFENSFEKLLYNLMKL